MTVSAAKPGKFRKSFNAVRTYLSKPQNFILLLLGIILTVTTVVPMLTILQDTVLVHDGSRDTRGEVIEVMGEDYTLWNWQDLATGKIQSRVNGQRVTQSIARVHLWTPLLNSVLISIFACAGAILYGGFFDHIQGKVVTLMIGTNNRKETAEQVADGIKACVEAIKVRVPKATIFLHPMLPRIDPKNAELRAKNDRTNELIKPLADGKKVVWVDLRPVFEGPDVTPERQKELLPDGTHPSVEGFRLWREAVTPYLRKYAK